MRVAAYSTTISLSRSSAFSAGRRMEEPTEEGPWCSSRGAMPAHHSPGSTTTGEKGVRFGVYATDAGAVHSMPDGLRHALQVGEEWQVGEHRQAGQGNQVLCTRPPCRGAGFGSVTGHEKKTCENPGACE